MYSRLGVVSYLLAVCWLPFNALAFSVNESGDAGNTIATAQVLPAGSTAVNAEIATDQDTDLFRFTLNAGTTFTIEVLEIDPALDMNLIVFNSLGQGLAGDDDDDDSCTPVTTLGSLDSCLTLTLSAGDYYFAVGDNNMAAFESVADFNTPSDFIDNDSGILGVPTTEMLGLVGPEGGPTDLNDIGLYVVNFSQPVQGSGTVATAIPTLSIWAFLVLAVLLAFVGLRSIRLRLLRGNY